MVHVIVYSSIRYACIGLQLYSFDSKFGAKNLYVGFIQYKSGFRPRGIGRGFPARLICDSESMLVKEAGLDGSFDGFAGSRLGGD